MDDEFLFLLRERPNAEYAGNLYRALAQYDRKLDQSQPRIHRFSVGGKSFPIAVLILAIIITAVVAIPPARALVSSLITKIAGLTFEVNEDYTDYGGDVTTIEPQIMSFKNAQSLLPYEIHLPTYLPVGYVMNETVDVFVGEAAGPFANTIRITWSSNANRSTILLSITEHDDGDRELVAPDPAIVELTLDNGRSAVLIRGGWDVDTRSWNYNHGFRLKWLVGDLTYDLMGDDQEQLIEIASSTYK